MKLSVAFKKDKPSNIKCLFGHHEWKYMVHNWCPIAPGVVDDVTFMKWCKYCGETNFETYPHQYLLTNFKKLNTKLQKYIIDLKERERKCLTKNF